MSAQDGTVWHVVTQAAGWPDPWERPFITIEEAAPLLKVSRRTAYRRAASGELPTIGGRVPTAVLMNIAGLPVPPPRTAPRPRVY